MRQLRFSVLLLTVCALAACGFHLRGSYQLPAHISPLYIDQDSMSIPLYRQLRSNLKTSGVTLADSADDAATVLKADFEQQAHDVISVDSLGRAREYRLIYRLTFSLRSEEEALIEESKIQLTRNLLFNPEAVLGVAQEKDEVYENMIADSARQILQRMQALK